MSEMSVVRKIVRDNLKKIEMKKKKFYMYNVKIYTLVVRTE
jgi:hypothetical protein